MTDDTFLKSFFAKIIETPELQHEAKKLLKDGGESCIEILDLIHSDFRAQDTGERMRDSVTLGSTSRRLRTEDIKPTTKQGGETKRINYPFPNNTGNLLPSKYYSQFKAWYFSMMKPVEDRSDAEKQWIQNFKFKYDSPQRTTREYRNGSDDWRTNDGSHGRSRWKGDDGTSYVSHPNTNRERRQGFYESNEQSHDRFSREKANRRGGVEHNRDHKGRRIMRQYKPEADGYESPPWITEYDEGNPTRGGGRSRRSYKRSPSPSPSREEGERKVRIRRATKPPPNADSDEDSKQNNTRRRTQFANFSK